MPDLAAQLHAPSIGALSPRPARCGDCRRTPLPGERLHELEAGRQLCDLCFGALPEERRHAVRSERVHASERRLAVVPRRPPEPAVESRAPVRQVTVATSSPLRASRSSTSWCDLAAARLHRPLHARLPAGARQPGRARAPRRASGSSRRWPGVRRARRSTRPTGRAGSSRRIRLGPPRAHPLGGGLRLHAGGAGHPGGADHPQRAGQTVRPLQGGRRAPLGAPPDQEGARAPADDLRGAAARASSSGRPSPATSRRRRPASALRAGWTRPARRPSGSD